MRINNFFKLVIAIGVSELAGIIGAVFSGPAIQGGWYDALVKPALNPPGWVFGPVWTALYLLIGVALFLVWRRGWRVSQPLLAKSDRGWNPWSRRLWSGDWQRANVLAIFIVQYLLNVLWSLVFFGWHRPDAAFFVSLALWFSVVYLIINFYRFSRTAAWLLLPYLLWVSFAVYLNYILFVLN